LVYRDGRIDQLAPGHAPKVLDGVDHAWLWTRNAAPQRVTAAEVGAWRPERSRHLLRVQIARRPGEKLAGHRVVVAPREMWHEVPEAMLPAWDVPPSGRLSVPDDSSRPRRLRLLAVGQGSWWQEVATGADRLTLAPSPAADRAITVLGPDGAPAPTATITVLDGASGRSRQEVLAVYRCEPTGSATIEALPDAGVLTLIVAAPTHAPSAIVARPSGWPEQTRLRRGSTVHGVIVDEQARPVAGARVSAEAWIDAQVSAVVARRAVTEGDGTWRLAGLPLGGVALEAAAERFATHSAQVELQTDDVDLGRIVLQRGLDLAVRVVDDLGAGVAGAELRAGAVAATSDRGGRARLRQVPAGQALTILARAPGHLPATRTVASPLPREVELPLQRAFQVRGRFVTADHLPIADGGVRVETGSSYRDEPLAEDGGFELELRPEIPAVLVLRSPATQDVRLSLEPGAAGERRDLGDVAAPAGWTVRGRAVRADDGEGVANARVWCPRPSEWGEIVSWVHGDVLETSSDGDGGFRLTGLPDRPALLRLDGPGLARAFRTVQPDPSSPLVDIGDVLLVEGATLRVAVDSERADGAIARADLRGAWLESDMLTAPVVDGEATLRQLPPGPLKLTVLAGQELLCEEDLTIGAEDRDVEVDCGDEPLRVSGVVLAGNRRATGGYLHWMPPADEIGPGLIMHTATGRGLKQDRVFGGGRPQVDVVIATDGTFATEALRPGRWSVAWLPIGGALSAPREVELPRAAHHELTLSFSELAIAGRVVDPAGEPVPGAHVRDLDSAAMAIAGEAGDFLLTDLVPGRHRLFARQASRTTELVTVELEPDDEPEAIVLTLEEREDQLSVHVQTGDGPAAQALVFVEIEGAGLRLASADSAGVAQISLQQPLPGRARVAAFAGGGWGFGDWQVLSTAGRSLFLTLPLGGTMLIASETPGEPLIRYADWDVSRLLTLVGMRPALIEGSLVLTGLPPGLYSVSLGRLVASGEVRPGTPLKLALN
jgi:hypothetical protein